MPPIPCPLSPIPCPLSPPEDINVAKWQHAWISVNPNERDDINKLEQMGNEGWELVSVIPWGQSIFLMFFKRQKEA